MENLFDRSSYLYEEPANLLKQELREPALYNAIIKAIAEGASRLNDITTKVGEENSVVAKYLKKMCIRDRTQIVWKILLHRMGVGLCDPPRINGTCIDRHKDVYKRQATLIFA